MMWTTQPRSDVGGLAGIVSGDGPPVLMIHGVGLRAEAWGAQKTALAKGYRVISVDLPGHGQSDTLDALPDLTDYVDAVETALIEPAFVVGHSMGAMVALALAVKRPERVRGVCAMNAIYRRDAKAADAVQARAAALDGVHPADPDPTLMRWFGTEPSAARAACETWLRQVDPASYKAAYGVFAHGDAPADSALSQLQMPALFMTGGLEPNSTPEMSKTMADLVPQGRAVIVPGAAHMMPMTHAAAVNQALVDFAQEVWT